MIMKSMFKHVFYVSVYKLTKEYPPPPPRRLEGQKIQRPIQQGQKDKQWSTKHSTATQTPLKTRDELKYIRFNTLLMA